MLNSKPAQAQQTEPPFKNASAIKRLDGSRISATEIDETVNGLMKAAKVPGLGLAILNGGRVVYLKGYGVRDKENNLPLTPDSVMAAASLTKATFAYMVMQLVQEKTLDLDKPLYQYLPKPLPDYPNYKDLSDDERYKRITARMVLSHTTGFPNLRRFTEEKRLRINFEPGSRYAYSGEGIDLLQFIVEAITNKSAGDLMAERVFQPLGMSRTSMVWESRFDENYVNGYDEEEHSLGPQKRKRPDAAGSMQTTPRDFARLLEAIMQSKGLRPETRDLMLSPQVEIRSKAQFPTLSEETSDANKAIRLSYGLGWGLFQTPYGKAFFKEGHDDGRNNYAVCLDKAQTCMLIMANSSNGEGIYKELLEKLMKNTFTPVDWENFTPYNSKTKTNAK